MLLLNTAALPTLLRYRHAQLGRLCVPGCNSQLAETLATMKVGFDNGCHHGLDPVAVSRMHEQIAGWPPMGARLAKAYPWASTTSSVTHLADGGFREELILGGPLPDIHANLLRRELYAGVLLGDEANRARRLRRLADVLSEATMLDIDRSVTTAYGEIRAASGRSPSNDLWIAATALAYDLQLVTMDHGQAALPLVRTILI